MEPIALFYPMLALVLLTVAVGFRLRAVQGAIHLSYNDVRHRMYAYFLSMAVLVALWIRFALHTL